MRGDGRRPDELRPLDMRTDFLEQPHGSVLYGQGKTLVLCTATVEEGVPRWLYGSGRGWMTAEYSMLPASTGERTQRAATRGRPDGRDPATDRTRASRSVRLRSTWRTDAVARLRRPPGGRWDTLCLDHRRVDRGGSSARPVRSVEGALGLHRRGVRRNRRRRGGARPGLCGGLLGGDGHERRDDRRPPARRGAGD